MVNRPSFSKVLGSLLAIILLLFVCSIPVLYVFMQDLWLYLGTRAALFLLSLLAAFAFRKKAQTILAENEPQREKAARGLLLLTAVSFCWFVFGSAEKFSFHLLMLSRGLITALFGSFPPLVYIFCEQLFRGDLYLSLLLSLVILFVRLPAIGRGRTVQAG